MNKGRGQGGGRCGVIVWERVVARWPDEKREERGERTVDNHRIHARP